MAKGPNSPSSPKSPVTVRGNVLMSKDKSKVKVNFAKTAGTSQGKTPTKAKGKASPKSKKKKKQTTDAEIQCPSQTTQSTQWCQSEQSATGVCVKVKKEDKECCNSPPVCCKTPSMTKMASTGSESFAAFVYSARKIGTASRRRRSPCDWTNKADSFGATATSTSRCRVVFDSCERQFMSDYCRKRMDRCSMSRLPGCMYEPPPCLKPPVCAPVCLETVIKTPEKEETETKTEIVKIKEDVPPKIMDVPLKFSEKVPIVEEIPPKIPEVEKVPSEVPEVEKVFPKPPEMVVIPPKKTEVVVIPPKTPEIKVVIGNPVPVKVLKQEPPAIENNVVVVVDGNPPDPMVEEEMEDDCPPPPCSSSCFVACCSPPSCLPSTRPRCFEACEFPFADVTSRSYAMSYCSRARWCCPYDDVPIKYCRGSGNDKVESCFYQAVDLEAKPTIQRWKHERLTN